MTPTITAVSNGWIVTTADGAQHIATAEMVVSAATAQASEYEVCQATQGDGDWEEVPGERAAWNYYFSAYGGSKPNFDLVDGMPRAAFRGALRIAIAANKSEPRRITEDELGRMATCAYIGGSSGLRNALRAVGIIVE